MTVGDGSMGDEVVHTLPGETHFNCLVCSHVPVQRVHSDPLNSLVKT